MKSNTQQEVVESRTPYYLIAQELKRLVTRCNRLDMDERRRMKNQERRKQTAQTKAGK